MKGSEVPKLPDASATSPQAADATTPAPAQDDASRFPLSRRMRRVIVAVLAVLILVPTLLVVTGNFELLAQSIMLQLTPAQPPIEAEAVRPSPQRASAEVFTFENSHLHPHRMYPSYFTEPLDRNALTSPSAALIPAFRDLLGIYVQRQGEDDNFTIRVIDERTTETLEVFALEEARDRYERTQVADWSAIDRMRRDHTSRLVKKYAAQGIPKAAISVKWGRANQIREAREREEPFINFEVRLARYLGLSLLVTEIGTVETFNDDRLVSSVGARSRYQMMPYILRQNDIHHYKLRAAYGNTVDVYEEWHPLLTMEPAFKLVRGYVNAVGHEVPGISSYHTGPGNMFKIYRMFLSDAQEMLSPETTVMDAYMWALTLGFDEISSKTSFKGYSRGYIPSGYGALRAVDDLPIDTSRMFLAERVQLKEGRKLHLSDLLRALEENGPMLYWGSTPEDEEAPSRYTQFRRLNPHIALPAAAEDGSVPAKGDIQLVDEVGNAPVRFFLPLNASQVLALSGINVIDPEQTFRFDANTYSAPSPGERTIWDSQYEALVRDVEQFGFSLENRSKLNRLVNRFEELAAANPTHYRRTQLDVIKTHQQLWQFSGWETLASAAQAARGSLRMPVRPPDTPEPLPARPPIPNTDR